MQEATKEGVIKPPVSEEETKLFRIFMERRAERRAERGKAVPNTEQATQRLRQGEIPEEFKEFSPVLEVKRGLDTKGIGFIVNELTKRGFDRENVELFVYCRESRDPNEYKLGGYLIHWGASLEQRIRWTKTDIDRVKTRYKRDRLLEIYEEDLERLKAEMRLQNQLKDAWRKGNLKPVEHHLLHKQEEALERLTPLSPFVAHVLPGEAERGKIGLAAESFIEAGIEYLLTKQLLKEVKQEKGRKKE